MGKNQDPDPGAYNNFLVKILKFFDAVANPDPGFGNLLDPGPGIVKIRVRDPG
jgi:hypothetical protein